MNDPVAVAGAFHAHLTGAGRFSRHFDEVVLGVLDRTRASTVLGAFRTVFAVRTSATAPAGAAPHAEARHARAVTPAEAAPAGADAGRVRP
ncbi:hypothetical protein [Streptomyces chryseus]